MRVLFLTHSYPRWMGDAAGSFLLRLAQALAGHGVEVAVLAPNAPGLARHDSIGGVAVTRFRYAPRAWETLAYTGTMAEDARRSWKGRLSLFGFVSGGSASALRAQREFSPDVIHAHWWFPAGVMGAVASALSSRPLMVTMHGSDVRFAAALKAARPLFTWVNNSAAVVTTVSSWLASQVTAIAPTLRPVVAPMPAATDLFRPNDSLRDPARVLFVGRLNEQKGILPLLDAVAQMSEGVFLDVVGDGPLGAVARERADTLGLASRVTWLGSLPQHELPELYQRAAVLAVPSVGEGLGLASVESQLCGTPVVAFDSGGLSDTLQDGRTGVLVPEGDVSAFADALGRLMAHPVRARAMGKEGRDWALAQFGPDAAAARYAELYRAAVSA